jgi:UDPglucose 6-dehydrogenase
VYCPEFLNQGTALQDWSKPHRIVLGVWQDSAASHARQLLSGVSGRYLVTEPTEAEAIKYVSNAFLATRISFANEIARLCEFVGVDVTNVLRGSGLDPRIGELFWRPGIGYGDSCLPKDLDALIQLAATYGHRLPILESVQLTNRAQHLRPLSIVREECAQLHRRPLTIAVLGVAYEPHSDDIRAAPSRSLIPQLALIASTVIVWDPLVDTEVTARLFPLALCAASAEDAVRDADVVLALTEYAEVVEGRWASALKRNGKPVIVVDAKNCLSEDLFDPAVARYRAIGKPRKSFSPYVRAADESGSIDVSCEP